MIKTLKVNALELIGQNILMSNTISKIFSDNFFYYLNRLSENDVLILDFGKIGLVDTTSMLISMAKPLKLYYDRTDLRNVVLINLSQLHKDCFINASKLLRFNKNPIVLFKEKNQSQWHYFGKFTNETESRFYSWFLEAQIVSEMEITKRYQNSQINIINIVDLFTKSLLIYKSVVGTKTNYKIITTMFD
jgi:hypothetical protein